MKAKFRVKRSAGLTLLEVLVAVGLGSSLLLVLLLTLSSGAQQSAALQGQLVGIEEARVGISILERDLSRAVNLDEFYFKAGTSSLESDTFGFFTHVEPRLQAQKGEGKVQGSLCWVLYHAGVAPDMPGVSGEVSRKWYRQVVTNEKLFQILQGGGRPQDAVSPQIELSEPIVFDLVRVLGRPRELRAGQLNDWSPGGADGPDCLDLEFWIAGRTKAARLRRVGSWDDESKFGDLESGIGTDGLYRFVTRLRVDPSVSVP